jgi:tetratricopeptide (TPR) repeat protein
MAEPHASLGFARLFYDRDWAGAEQAFLAAIRINPAYASAHQWYAWLLMVTRRWKEMMHAMQRAHDLDPLSLVINDHLGYALGLVGRTDEALQQLQGTLDLDPQFALTHQRLGGLYLSQGRFDEAVEAFESAVRLSSGAMGLGALGYAAATCGRTAQAETLLAQLRERSRAQFVSPLEFAFVYAGLNDVDGCFDALRQAVAERVSDLVRLDLLPWPPAVRDDPRFASILAGLGLRVPPA